MEDEARAGDAIAAPRLVLVCLGFVALVGWGARGTALARSAGGSVVPWLAVVAAVSALLIAGALALAARRVRTLEVT